MPSCDLILYLAVFMIMSVAQAGKTYFITGCSRGIGFGMVQHILEKQPGDRVIATCRDISISASLTKLSEVYPKERFLLLPLEVSSVDSHKNVIEMLSSEGISAIDVLIANAGVATAGHPHDEFFNSTPEDLDYVWKTNVLGSMLTLQAYSDLLLNSRSKLAVVVSSRLASIAQASGLGSYTAYRASKAALNMLAVTYAADQKVRSAGGKALCMHPGWVQTDMGGSGGRKAPVTVEQSCRGILNIIDQACQVQAGSKAEGEHTVFKQKLVSEHCVFVGFDGELLPW